MSSMATSRAATQAIRGQLRPTTANTTSITRIGSFRHRYSTEAFKSASASSPATHSHTNAALIGGLVGGGLVLGGLYSWYHFSGARTAVNTTYQIKNLVHQGSSKLHLDGSETTAQVLNWMRDMAMTYATWIPGGRAYVESTFDEIQRVREEHGDRVDGSIKEASDGLQRAIKEKGVSLEAAGEVGKVLQKLFDDLTNVAGELAEEVVHAHPELQKQLGGSVDRLKKMGDDYGPEAKKQVHEAWRSVAEVVHGGLGPSSMEKIRKIVEEKTHALRKLGDDTWQRGLDQAKPLLDKAPQVKKLVNDNADALKQSDMGAVWSSVREAVSSGNVATLESLVNKARDQAKEVGGQAGGEIEGYLSMIPGAGDVGAKINQLRDIGLKHGKEAQHLLEETREEIHGVLEKKLKEADGLGEKAKKDVTEGEK